MVGNVLSQLFASSYEVSSVPQSIVEPFCSSVLCRHPTPGPPALLYAAIEWFQSGFPLGSLLVLFYRDVFEPMCASLVFLLIFSLSLTWAWKRGGWSIFIILYIPYFRSNNYLWSLDLYQLHI